MKPLLDFLSRPLNFALVMASFVAIMIYNVGQWSIEPQKQISEKDLNFLAQRVATTFFMSQKPDSPFDNAWLDQALVMATKHPRVCSATLRSATNQVLGLAQKEQGAFEKKSEFTMPLLGTNGQFMGMILFELGPDDSGILDLKNKILLYSLMSFLLSFVFCCGVLYRKDSFLPQLLSALKQITAGQIDIQISTPENKEYQGLADAFNLMIEGLRERDRMRHSLGRIMDPKIAEILIKENPKVGGLRRQATILFCDIRNYTSLCEELSPDELQSFLNEYWKDTVEIIMEQEGTIDKFHGDGVCVIFGAPTLHTDDPLRAIRTAWRLAQNVDRLNARREDLRKLPIQIGIGIHSGEVIAGNIGSERRMDYTVVGDVVNVAARIEELNKKFGTKILISDSVYEVVEDHVHVKTLTLAHLRGHKKPILIHALREFVEDPASQTLPDNKVA